jgi:protein TonB
MQTAPLQTAMFPPPSVPAPAPRPAPTVSPGYRSLLSAWLESHKRYPESARARGEEGRAVLRFRVDRSGRVLNYALAASTGFADLDAAIDGMMRGATLPPFPADMAASDVEVSVTVRFSLTR